METTLFPLLAVSWRMTDAFWVALFGAIAPTVTGIVTVIYSRNSSQNSRASKLSSEANAQAIAEVHEKVNGGLQAAVAKAEDAARRRTDPRILVVDDDPVDIELTKRPLLAFGCDVFVAASAAEAEQLLLSQIGPGRGFPFDFVLLDLRMPLNGAEAVCAIFEAKAPRVPIAILTGATRGSMSVGKVPYVWIEKPLDEVAVKSLLDRWSIPYHKKL